MSGSARALSLLVCCGGCYDVDALSKLFDASTPDLATTSSPDLAGADLAPGNLDQLDGGVDAAVVHWRNAGSGVTTALRAIAVDGQKLYIVGAASTIIRISADDQIGQDGVDPGYNLRGAAAAGGSVWAVGDDGTILQRGSTGWSLVAGGAGNTLNGAFGLAMNDVLAVGTSPNFCRNATCDDSGTLGALFAVWARSGTDAFAAGEGGLLLHHDTAFTTLTSNSSANLHGIFGIGTRILVVGNGGAILRSDNDSDWSTETSGTNRDLFAVWMSGAEAFAVGANGVILHRDASGAWTQQHSGGSTLRAVVGRSSTDVWAAGDDGTLLHYVP